MCRYKYHSSIYVEQSWWLQFLNQMRAGRRQHARTSACRYVSSSHVRCIIGYSCKVYHRIFMQGMQIRIKTVCINRDNG